MKETIPKAKFALIGGSGTWGVRFPEDLKLPNVELVEVYRNGFETPYGRSAPFKLLTIAGQSVLRVAMHGMWKDDGTPLISPWIGAKQVAWVLEQAGVQWALVEGSVGGINNPDQPNKPLPPWSVVITTDYMMLFRPDDDKPFNGSLKRASRMKNPFCHILRRSLLDSASLESKFVSVHDHGVYICSTWGRFETKIEINVFASMGANVIGHTLGHEVPVLRRANIRLASLNIVSNHAEGIGDWSGTGKDSMAEFYYECPKFVGPVMVNALQQVIESGIEPPQEEDIFIENLRGKFPVSGA